MMCSLREGTVYYFSFGNPKDSKGSVCNAGDLGPIPGLGRSPGEGNGTYCSILAWRILLDRGAQWVIVHRVAKTWT